MTETTAKARELADMLEWLSSRHGEHMDDGPRLTEFCHRGREAVALLRTQADEIEALQSERDERLNLPPAVCDLRICRSTSRAS